MKHSVRFLLCFFLIAFFYMPSAQAAKDKPQIPKIKKLDDAAMETLQKQSAAPEENTVLDKLTGDWKYTLKYWSSKDADPQTSTGMAHNEMTLGNRFLSSETNTRLFLGGQSFNYEARSLVGYDKNKKSFSAMWIDTMRSGMTIGDGQYIEKDKTLSLTGSLSHPWMDKTQKYRAELHFTDSDSYTLSIYMGAGTGQEYKFLDVSFERPN